MTPSDLKAIRERMEAIGSGKWEQSKRDGWVVYGPALSIEVDSPMAREIEAPFIAHAPEDIRALLRLLDDLTGDLLAVEWGGTLCEGLANDGAPCCSYCQSMEEYGHANDCRIDARLTQLGLATQTERDAERARRAGK